jgi:hypothetical protein
MWFPAKRPEHLLKLVQRSARQAYYLSTAIDESYPGDSHGVHEDHVAIVVVAIRR